MDEQKFSVSMCVYGRDNPEWFEVAVESILNQSIKPTEIILVVDGPIPSELENVISKYEQNTLFKIIRFAENQGHGNARRAGLEACSNELVAIMDADDISHSTRFEKQLTEFSLHSDVDVVGGNITEFIDDPKNIVGARVVPTDNNEIIEYMKKRCPMNLVTVMFKKESVERAGGFIDWYCEEDYYLWIRMAQENMKFSNVPDNLVNVRVGKEMYNRRGGKKYFQSEAKLQKYMLDNKIIGFGTYIMNVSKRFVVQILLPNKIRGWVFKKFARKKGIIMSEKKYKVGYTTGVFDMFHVGHLNILKRAKEQCEYLIVGVSTDETVENYKNKTPIIKFEERSAIVEAIKYVDKVVPQTSMNKMEAYKKLKFNALFHGSDWQGSDMYNKIVEEFAAVGVDVVFLPHTDGISSTLIREKANK